MRVKIGQNFWKHGSKLLELCSMYGFVIADISGTETLDEITLDDIHLPDRAKILRVSSGEEVRRNRNAAGYEAISAPNHCLLTENYQRRVETENVIGYAGRCPILQPTTGDLCYSKHYRNAGTEKIVLAFFDFKKGCAIYGIGNRELSVLAQDEDSVDHIGQKDLARFLEKSVLYRSPFIRTAAV